MSSARTVGQTDLWLVAGADDEVANAVDHLASTSGLLVSRLSFTQFARCVTVDFSGSQATVAPSAPILLRTAWEASGDSSDARFLRLEAHAQAWAACALCDAPVINRPTEIGITGDADHVTPLSLLRAGARVPERRVELPHEVYSSEWIEQDGDWAVQDLVSYATAVVPDRPEGAGPYRYRRWRPTSRYTTVTVVDGDGWANDYSATSDPAALIEPSLAIVRALALRFGAVTWAVPDGAPAEVARVEAYPAAWAIGPHLDQVARALLTALVG